jgi:colicin import membrane protein
MEATTLEVAEYNPVEAGLEALRTKYADLAFDLRSTKGNAEARAARKELVSLRTSLEAKRKELKAPLLARGELIDSEAKRITAEVIALEKPIDDQIKADEARRETERLAREQAERARVARIQASIRAIAEAPLRAVGKSSADIEQEIDALEAFEVDASYDEFRPGAQAAKDAALAQLRTTYGAARAHEEGVARLQAERAELARQQAEAIRVAHEQAAAEQERLARIEAERQAQERVERERAALQERIDNQIRIDREAAAAKEQAEREEFARQQAAIEAKNAAESARIEEEKAALSRRIQAEEAARTEAARVAEEAARAESARVFEERQAARRAELEATSAPLVRHQGSFISRRSPTGAASFPVPVEEVLIAPARATIIQVVAAHFSVPASTASHWLVQLWGNGEQA